MISFTKTPLDLAQLCDEIEAAAITQLAPTQDEQGNNVAVYVLAGDEDSGEIAVYLADEDADEAAVKKALAPIVSAHKAGARALAQAADAKGAEILGLLAGTDMWAARAVEEGTPMSAARIAYRKQMRSALGAVQAATTVAAVDAVALPDPPPAE